MEIGGSQALMSTRINGGTAGFNQPANGASSNLYAPAQQQTDAQMQQTASVTAARGVTSAGGNAATQSVQQSTNASGPQSEGSAAGGRIGSRVDLYA